MLVRLGLFGIHTFMGGAGLGCHVWLIWLGPCSVFWSAVLNSWWSKVSVDICGKKGFRGGLLTDFQGPMQLFNTPHVREREKSLLLSTIVWGGWNGFFSDRFEEKSFHVAFVEGWWGWSSILGLSLSSFVRSVKILNFMTSWEGIRVNRPGVFCGMAGCFCCLGWLAALLGLGLLQNVLAICLSVPWVLTLLICSLSGMSWMTLMLRVLSRGCLRIPLFGQTGAWCWLSRRKWEHLDLLQPAHGLVWNLVGAFVEFLVPRSLVSGLSCGGFLGTPGVGCYSGGGG